ncbi:crAss001_48 related protein [Limosilactobacillus oris]|uniref:crAss001_48 related protein n=1 Tax=Limosilactobacillus oris TaxID=1632 RepID=UPI0024B3B8EE|nr:hypothetical protein [Limosilactobacillus oris]WHO86437.1 hypothetical protein QLX69_04350 [Limosilactobacillus oris]
MSVKETVNDFIQGVKAGKYEVVASTVDTFSGQSEFTFTVNVKKDVELLERLRGEFNDLLERRHRLDDFMCDDTFADLSHEERYAMLRQREGMTDEMAALHKRIELIKERMK